MLNFRLKKKVKVTLNTDEAYIYTIRKILDIINMW